LTGPITSTRFETVPRDEQYFRALCVGASAANLLGASARALSPHASRVVVAGEGALCWRSVHRFLGPLAALLGQVGRASMHFEAATSIHEQLGAKPFLVRDRLEHADLLGMRSVVARHSRRERKREVTGSGDGGGW
jgi:hypothetical protein